MKNNYNEHMDFLVSVVQKIVSLSTLCLSVSIGQF